MNFAQISSLVNGLVGKAGAAAVTLGYMTAGQASTTTTATASVLGVAGMLYSFYQSWSGHTSPALVRKANDAVKADGGTGVTFNPAPVAANWKSG